MGLGFEFILVENTSLLYILQPNKHAVIGIEECLNLIWIAIANIVVCMFYDYIYNMFSLFYIIMFAYIIVIIIPVTFYFCLYD